MRILIAGGGQTALYVARRLIRERHELILMERDEERCATLSEELDAMVIRGNARSMQAWQQAGIAEADTVLCLTDSDESNIAVALIADELAPGASKILRLSTPEFSRWQTLLSKRDVKIECVVHPEERLVKRMFRVLGIPGVSDVREFVDGRIRVFGMNVEHGSNQHGVKLAELQKQIHPHSAMITMIYRDQNLIFPHGDVELEAGDHIQVAAVAEHFDAALGVMGISQRESIERVFIAGARVGQEVAAALESTGVSVKLFETDPYLCQHLSATLRRTVVINAPEIDQETLLRENVEGVDAFLAMTADDNANIVSALFARRLGAKKLMALVNNAEYLPLTRRLGINTTVSLCVESADAILSHLRQGGVYKVRTYQEEGAEAIELVAPPDSVYLGRPLKTVRFPRNAVVAAIVKSNGEAMIPRGEDCIEAYDRVVLFAAEPAVLRLETEFLESRA